METAKIRKLERGMTLFSKNAGLMVNVTDVNDTGFDFHVMNGLWQGRAENGALIGLNAPVPTETGGQTRRDVQVSPDDFEMDFVQVLSVTPEEADQWYLRYNEGKRVPVRTNAEVEADCGDAPDYTNGADQVFEAKIVITLMGQDASPERLRGDLETMDLSRIEREMDQGEFVGRVRVASLESLPEDQVASRLRRLGNDGTFFDLGEGASVRGGTEDEAAGRILRAQVEQGMSNAALEAASREFIEHMGMSDAYAAFLEARADAPEPDTEDEDMTP